MLTTIQIQNHEAPWLALKSQTQSADTIHFSAANGFPVGSYLHFLRRFQSDYSVTAMDCRATWRSHDYGIKTVNMHDFADDLITALEQQYDHPVIGIGHSMGGLVTLIAARKRPELFSKLVLLEPASLPAAWIDLFYRRLPRQILWRLFPFIEGSAKRRNIWPDGAAFIERYRNHATFQHFTEQALLDYAEYGLRDNGDGMLELVFPPAWEAHIFAIVEYIWKFLRHIKSPTLLIRAEHSNLYSKRQFDRANRGLPSHINAVNLPKTHHLFPNEQPGLAYDAIDSWLSQQRTEQGIS